MGHHKHDEKPFVLEGRFLGFLFKDGYKVKYLKILTNDREWLIEVSKSLRKTINLDLPLGEWVQVSGEQRYSSKYPFPELKAEAIAPCIPGQSAVAADAKKSKGKDPASSTTDKQPASSGKILVCGKSDCWKRGGKGVCGAIKDGLRDRGLDENVSVQVTGCMKHCKSGPNVVVMPAKERYSRIRPGDVDEILDAHFAPEASSEAAPESIPEPVSMVKA